MENLKPQHTPAPAGHFFARRGSSDRRVPSVTNPLARLQSAIKGCLDYEAITGVPTTTEDLAGIIAGQFSRDFVEDLSEDLITAIHEGAAEEPQ